MMGKTHMAVGFLFGLGAIETLGLKSPSDMAIMSLASTGGALLPDIDHPNSKLAHSNIVFSLISNVVSQFTKHRQFCHSILFCGLVGALSYMLGEYLVPLFIHLIAKIDFLGLSGHVPGNLSYIFALGIFIGAISHLAADIFNPQGAPLFYPIKTRISIMSISTQSMGEIIFSAVVGAGIIFVLFLMVKQGTLDFLRLW